MLRTLSFIFLVMIGFTAFAAQPAHAAIEGEQAKIEDLLDAFNEPGIIFIRNGEEHDGAWARKHLKEKLDETKDVKTAEDFITKVASMSRESGKPYMVKMKDGKEMAAGKWLQKKLEEINAMPRK